jgi:hypothetical protein
MGPLSDELRRRALTALYVLREDVGLMIEAAREGHLEGNLHLVRRRLVELEAIAEEAER